MRIKSTDTQPYYEENGAGENQNKYSFLEKLENIYPMLTQKRLRNRRN